MDVPKIEKEIERKKVVIQSEQLFQGNREVIIEHCADQYRLMITKAGKLILNK